MLWSSLGAPLLVLAATAAGGDKPLRVTWKEQAALRGFKEQALAGAVRFVEEVDRIGDVRPHLLGIAQVFIAQLVGKGEIRVRKRNEHGRGKVRECERAKQISSWSIQKQDIRTMRHGLIQCRCQCILPEAGLKALSK